MAALPTLAAYGGFLIYVVMYFAFDNKNNRVKPCKEIKGEDLFCPGCGGKLVVKTGDIKVWHFAHEANACKHFEYKGMSEWHRHWQEMFKEEQREKRFEVDGEIHIADVVNSNGVVIEFQNSSISSIEKESRDEAYPMILWVVNAKDWVNNIQISKEETYEYKRYKNQIRQLDGDINKIINSSNEVTSRDIDIIDINSHHQISYKNHIPYRILNELTSIIRRVNIADLKRLKKNISKPEKTHEVVFNWKYERKIWSESTTPVFLDFCDGEMIYLQLGKIPRLMTKQEFINKYVK